ncbi:hypothetical protein BGP77_11570 [Saccharospirillum sp. MSK14-1]|uniref:type II restriction endonuclease n=1 Tax=Saccharospirillum sp. MSK14-1 TaxID=1897632 RepID=UPI000D363A9B|nr:type II restriction endonuclease [Saccharospirillum sp. MSK14-1]PTY38577.1 hypothetical protein BGP77_11570 [Saccharospirillum sp. MSK14-1]
MMDFSDWLAEVSSQEYRIYIKRLSANDTGASGGHQVGIYFPKSVLGDIFPSLTPDKIQPDSFFKATVESHDLPEQTLRAIYYNQKTRNEKRITRWKDGVHYSPLQDHESTGSIAVFAFEADGASDCQYLRVWVCRHLGEEQLLESMIGNVEPGEVIYENGQTIFSGPLFRQPLNEESYPKEWNTNFPTGKEIVDYLFSKGFYSELSPDKRILKRRVKEFDLFKSVEASHVIPVIRNGFHDVDEFIFLANSILNRRKSRSGRSLELHLENIFKEEGLVNFGTQCVTEGNKKPDFLFPNCSAYHDQEFPSEKLRMLAVKTTVKDRWRQVLNEASKINVIHLFTLQEGVSLNQFKEMRSENVKLVVPNGKNNKKFHEDIREHLMSLDEFINETGREYDGFNSR